MRSLVNLFLLISRKAKKHKAFLLWRWRKAANTQLCDTKNCPLRHDPTDGI